MLNTAPLKPGDLFERDYRVLSLLGHGGSAWVYHVRQEFNGIEYALKLIPNRHGTDHAKRGRDEAKALHALSQHPKVVQTFGSHMTSDGAYVFLVMERLEGFVLRDVLDTLGYLTLPEALLLGADICDAVEAAHRLGIIHRDIKPGNVFVCQPNLVKILDFGIAKFRRDQHDTTGRMKWRGTPLYMAPERLQGYAATERSDVYSIGVMLHEAVLGTHVCRLGDDQPEVETIVCMHLSGLPPLIKLLPDVPRSFSDIIARATAREPLDRWPSPLELGTALRNEFRALELYAKERALCPTLRNLVMDTRQAHASGTSQSARWQQREPSRRWRLPDVVSPTLASTVVGDCRAIFNVPTRPMSACSRAGTGTKPSRPAPHTATDLAATERRHVAEEGAQPKPTVPATPVAKRSRSSAVFSWLTSGAHQAAQSGRPGMSSRTSAPAANSERVTAPTRSTLAAREHGRMPVQAASGHQSVWQRIALGMVIGTLVAIPLGVGAGRALAGSGGAPRASVSVVRTTPSERLSAPLVSTVVAVAPPDSPPDSVALASAAKHAAVAAEPPPPGSPANVLPRQENRKSTQPVTTAHSPRTRTAPARRPSRKPKPNPDRELIF